MLNKKAGLVSRLFLCLMIESESISPQSANERFCIFGNCSALASCFTLGPKFIQLCSRSLLA